MRPLLLALALLVPQQWLIEHTYDPARDAAHGAPIVGDDTPPQPPQLLMNQHEELRAAISYHFELCHNAGEWAREKCEHANLRLEQLGVTIKP